MPSLTARLIASLFRMTGSLRKRYSDGPDFLKNIEQSRAEQLAEFELYLLDESRQGCHELAYRPHSGPI